MLTFFFPGTLCTVMFRIYEVKMVWSLSTSFLNSCLSWFVMHEILVSYVGNLITLTHTPDCRGIGSRPMLIKTVRDLDCNTLCGSFFFFFWTILKEVLSIFSCVSTLCFLSQSGGHHGSLITETIGHEGTHTLRLISAEILLRRLSHTCKQELTKYNAKLVPIRK